MKKSYFILAAVAATFAACSQNDVVTEITENEVPIGFSNVYIDNVTRAINTGAYTTANFETLGNTFGVYGYKTTATQTNYQVFNDVKVEFQTASGSLYDSPNDWVYSPLKYWDKTATSYAFFAYAPHQGDFTGTVAMASASSNGFSITGFKQATSQTDMVDLMTDLTNQANVTSSSASKPLGENDVEFTFGHILSNINVQMAVSEALKSDETDNPVTVNSVTIGAIKMDGEYSYNTSAYSWTLTDPQVTTATTFSATLSGTSPDTYVFASKALKANTVEFTDVPALTDLLFVPQTVDAGYAITVQYKIGDEVFDKTILLSEFKNASNAGLATWQPGYKYTYQIIIGPTPILFDVKTVTDWEDGGTFAFTID